MKPLYLLLAIISYANAQPQWRVLNNAATNGNGQRFDDVFFLNENLGWAANGFYASVYKTTDGGETWTQQFNESEIAGDYYFRNIEFLNENIGFIGTLNNAVFKTTDGGITWNKINNITPNPAAICGLETIGETTVYGCGAYFTPAQLIKSTDSGETWTSIDMSAHANALVEVEFLNETTGFVAGRNASGATLLKTTDSGQTWTEIYNSGIQGEYVWKLQILESNTNIIFGSIQSVAPNQGKLIKSINGGETWQTYNAPETSIQAVGFISKNHGWMGGHATGFYQTVDGGATWTNLNIGSNLNRIFVINQNLAYASGTTLYKFHDSTLNTTTFEQERKYLNVSIQNNPVNNFLELNITFDGSDNLLIELYDSNGKFLNQLSKDHVLQKSSKTYRFDVSSLSAGIFILDFHNNSGRQSSKFVKL